MNYSSKIRRDSHVNKNLSSGFRMAAPASASASPGTKASANPPTGSVNSITMSGTTPKDNRSLALILTEFILVPLDASMFKILPEIGHLAPIILTAGALFMSTISFSFPLFMFGMSSIEAGVFYKMIAAFSDFVVTPRFGTMTHASERNKTEGACGSYFQSMTPSRFTLLLGNGLKKEFPNYPLYFITFASTYCIQGLLYFSNECTQLGPKYSNRPYLALMGAAMFITLYTLFLFVYSCESNLLSLLSTIVLAALVGYLISYQNFSLFGKQSVNLLFIPEIKKRSGMDYICVSTEAGKKGPSPSDMSVEPGTSGTDAPGGSGAGSGGTGTGESGSGGAGSGGGGGSNTIPYAKSIAILSSSYSNTIEQVKNDPNNPKNFGAGFGLMMTLLPLACLCGSKKVCTDLKKEPSNIDAGIISQLNMTPPDTAKAEQIAEHNKGKQISKNIDLNQGKFSDAAVAAVANVVRLVEKGNIENDKSMDNELSRAVTTLAKIFDS